MTARKRVRIYEQKHECFEKCPVNFGDQRHVPCLTAGDSPSFEEQPRRVYNKHADQCNIGKFGGTLNDTGNVVDKCKDENNRQSECCREKCTSCVYESEPSCDSPLFLSVKTVPHGPKSPLFSSSTKKVLCVMSFYFCRTHPTSV